MADKFTGTVDPAFIESAIAERAGISPNQQIGQDFQSWRYNVPQGFGASTLGTAYPKSRRKMRMEAEFNEYQKDLAKQEFERQQNERANMNLQLQFMQESRMQAEQDAENKANLAKLMREDETAKQAQNAMNSVIGFTRPDGTKVEAININDDDAVERIQSIMTMNPFGMEKQYVKEVIGGLLDDAVRIRESKTSAAQQAELSALDMSIRSGKGMGEFGQYDEQGTFIPNPQAMAVESTKLKMAEEQAGVEKEEQKEIKKEKRAEQKDIQSQVNKLDANIRGEQLKLIEQASTLGIQVNPDGTFDSAGLSERSRNLLKGAQDRIKLIEMDKAQVQGFNFKTIEDAQKAESEGRIPSGTVIFVNGKRAIVE